MKVPAPNCALAGGSLRLIEQNFDFDLLAPQKLLEKYVGRSVTVIRTNPATGAETREQTSFRKIADRVHESAFGIELSNAKDIPVAVKIVEPVPGDWDMVSESQKHIRGDAHSAVWRLMVPAGGKANLDYTARMRW